MDNISSNWVDFWENQTVMDDRSWEKNMELFLSGSKTFFPFHTKDTVLDIGSGPGFLAFFLKKIALKQYTVLIHPRDMLMKVEAGSAKMQLSVLML